MPSSKKLKAPLSLAAELAARDRCRYGLKGVTMLHMPTLRIFECGGSEWGADETLFVAMGENKWETGYSPKEIAERKPWSPEELAAGRRLMVVCLADIDPTKCTPAERVPASECFLLSPWRVTCCAPSRRRKVTH